MKTTRVRSRVVSLAIAIVLLLQISAVPAGAQGSRVPGFSAPSTETARNKHRRPVEVTFTKWLATYPALEGFTGGDVPGVFVGEVLERQVSQRLADQQELCYGGAPPTCGRIIRLEAMYEVQAGHRSFTALIRGGESGDTGAAHLDGVILFGWRTGERVHVEFQARLAPSPAESGCAGAPAGISCFQGTITISPDSED